MSLREERSTFRTVAVMTVESSSNAMAHGDAREGKGRKNWRIECVASTLHTTSERGVSSFLCFADRASQYNLRQ